MDNVTRARRSEIMSRVRSKDTVPEMIVRRLVHGMGYRYRLHAGDLPGRPDLVFRRRGKVIFVHGCFWHRHRSCSLSRLPKSRRHFWIPKLAANRARDVKNTRAMARSGWLVLTVWECELKDEARLKKRIGSFLNA